MRTFSLHKIIRDKRYERMLDRGAEVVLDSDQSNANIIKHLKAKLLEEAEEVISANNKEECISEIADLLEVIESLAIHLDINTKEIESAKLSKNLSSGGFAKPKIINKVSIDENDELVKYFINDPEKYPEISS